jgi:hypothetical protein
MVPSEQPTAFDLELRFHGICLFVPDPAAGTLAVLMPATGLPGDDPNVPQHVSMLALDTAYLQPGSPSTHGLWALAQIDGQHLTIEGAGQPHYGSLPEVLANIGIVAQRPVEPAAFGNNPPANLLAARIGLRSGACTGTGPVQCFAFPPGLPSRPLTSVIHWTMRVDQAQLDLRPVAFAGQTATAIPPLYPIGGRIQIDVYHTERQELPPDPMEPPEGDPETMMHFGAFYVLFGLPPGPVPVPEPCDFIDGELPYTCMGPAQSAITPT